MKPPKETWVNPKIEVRETPAKGKGMFASEGMAAGEELIRWGGTYVDGAEAKVLQAKGMKILQWDDDLWSAEWKGDDPGYFINHSCDANAWMKDTFTVVAKRNIKKDEEITADYSLWEADPKYVAKWDCACGSVDCRKKITGKDWQRPEVQERYAGHFAPLIQRRIDAAKGKIGDA